MRAAGAFDVLLTVDANREHQQNSSALPIAVVVLKAPSNDIDALLPLVPRVRELLQHLEPGKLSVLAAPPLE